jgi:hypothetical protein
MTPRPARGQASWFDKTAARREMWRATARGNPGREFEGRAPSWLRADGAAPRL